MMGKVRLKDVTDTEYLAPGNLACAACPEVLGFRQERTAPAGVDAWNPAFDVTPAELVTGWITEEGAWTPG